MIARRLDNVNEAKSPGKKSENFLPGHTLLIHEEQWRH